MFQHVWPIYNQSIKGQLLNFFFGNNSYSGHYLFIILASINLSYEYIWGEPVDVLHEYVTEHHAKMLFVADEVDHVLLIFYSVVLLISSRTVLMYR